jgi:uncharacterized protein YjbJ (UPF0337 family)
MAAAMGRKPMNDDQLSGEGRDLTGKVKETAGDFTGNSSLQSEGLADQLQGKAQKAYGAATDALSGGVGPLVDQAKGFAQKRPFAAAALLGVVGLALLNTLRGKR